jgi:ketosteroid isomerase-like protein
VAGVAAMLLQWPMQDTKLSKVVRAYVQAYDTEDRAAAESLFTDDFTFTSPHDNAIDRATYFERCWPDNETLSEQKIESIVVDGDKAFVTYLSSSLTGKSFRNTEFLTFRGALISSVNVYFGPGYQDGVFQS